MTTETPTPTSSVSNATSSSGRDALASLRIDRSESTASRSGGKLKWLVVLIVLAVGGYFGYQYGVQNGWFPSAPLADANWMPEIMQNRVEVRLASVTVHQGRSADAVVVATGYLESRRQAGIGARAAGRIDQIFFEEGNRVKQGEVLAELDHKDMDASLAAATASVARAKAALQEQEVAIQQAAAEKERAEALRASNSFSDSEYDIIKYAYLSALARKDSLKAEIELAIAQQQQTEQLRENMFIRAPFDGTVISKDAEVGESILPGGMGGGSGRGSVATIADLDHLEIECDVQEDFISRVSEGQETDIAVDAVPSKKYHGTVRKIIPMGDRARATIKVKVEIKDADELLFPEMSGTVFFLPPEQEKEIDDQPRTFCPSSAIDQDEAGNQFVWVVDNEKRAKKISVETGEDRDGKTEITSGLTGDERVIVNPDEISEGTPVKISE